MASQFDTVWVPYLTAAFKNGYEGGLEGNWATDILRKYEDVGEFVKQIDLGSVGAVTAMTGSPVFNTPNAYNMTLQTAVYQLGMQITVEDVKRDKIGMFETSAEEIGGKFSDHPTKLACAAIVANANAFDGKPFFSTTHYVVPAGVLGLTASGTQSNDWTSGTLPSLSVAAAATPTAAEAAKALLDVVSKFYFLTDEAGDPINGNARSFRIVTSNPAIQASMNQAIHANLLNSGNGSLDNPISTGLSGYHFEVSADPRLGSMTSAVFYVFRTDSVVKPFAWAEEEPPTQMYSGAGSYSEIANNAYLWSTKAVRTVGPSRWQYAMRGTFATAS